MKVSDIITEVQSVIVDTTAWPDPVTLGIINRGLTTIASGVLIPGKHQITPPLPDLYTTGTVNTVPATGVCTLPSDYQRNVVQVLNSLYEEIPIYASFRKFLQDYPTQDAGSVRVCAVHGKSLLYREIPAAAEPLTIHYYKKPTVLVADTAEPDCLPEHLQLPLLQSFTCAYIFNQIEDGIEGQKINTAYWKKEYGQALLDLEIALGMDGDPQYFANEWHRID